MALEIMFNKRIFRLFYRIFKSIKYRWHHYSDEIRIDLLKLRYKLPMVDITDLVQGNYQIPSPILEDVCLPPYFIGTHDHDDFHPMMKIILAVNPKILVELGTAHGNTVANICQACPESKVYTVNAPAVEQTGKIVTYSLQPTEIGRVYQKYGYTSQVTQILKNTLELDLSEYLPLGSVDLAIIDACHDTDYVVNDFFKVLPFMSTKGVILLHDTHPSMKGHLIGSYVACMQLRKKGYKIRYVSGTWWGIWYNDESFTDTA